MDAFSNSMERLSGCPYFDSCIGLLRIMIGILIIVCLEREISAGIQQRDFVGT
jgi:hypothetical protein